MATVAAPPDGHGSAGVRDDQAGTGSTQARLARSGLDAFVETVVSAKDVGRLDAGGGPPTCGPPMVAGVAPDRVAMATVHPRDVQP